MSVETAAPAAAPPKVETLRQMLWKRFRKHRPAMASLVLLGLLTLLCFASPLLIRKPTVQEVDGVEEIVFGSGLFKYTDSGEEIDVSGRFQEPSRAHLLGTDDLGRDILLRLLAGGRISIAIGLIASLASALIGVTVGAVSGYFGGWLDVLLMRFTDAMLSVPVLALMIVIAALDLDKIGLGFMLNLKWGDLRLVSIIKLLFVVVLFEWMGVARLVRGSVLSLRERDFVMAAKALGASHARIIGLHLVPNAIAPIIVATTLAAGEIILYEAVLSFLGLGIMPPTPSWGNMLQGAQEYMRKTPWLAVYPGILIWATVTGFNFLGDGLRDALDPKYISGKSGG